MTFARIESSIYRIENKPVSDMDILSYMKTQGMDYVPDTIVYDGKMHRFSTDPSKPGDDAGWYSADFVNGNIKLVYFGDWRKGIKSRFARGEKNDLSENERLEMEYKIEQHRKQEEAERQKLSDERASVAQKVWDSCNDATSDNPYLSRKKVFPHETKIDDKGNLVVPLYNENGVIRSLQFIPEGGKDKKFLWGTSVNGCFWWLGDPEAPRVFLVEGFATGASVNEATGATVFIAFSASSIPKVAKILREHGKAVTVIADNDPPGKEWASKAFGCRVLTIPIEGMDANDYQCDYLDNDKANHGDLKSFLPDLLIEPKMISIDDILKEELKIEWIIKGWIPSHSIGMIHGPSSSGKTTVMLDMILSSISLKGEWKGNKIKDPVNVIYLCGEGWTGVKRRIRAWLVENPTSFVGNFAAYPIPLDLDTPAGIHEIGEQINALGWNPDIIIIDTLNRYMSGDENSAQDTRTLLNCVDSLRNIYNCSGIYVHHTGNNEDAQKRARGSSAWRGALDFEISVIQDEETKQRVIEQTKMKDAELKPKMYGHLERVEIPNAFDDDGEPITSVVFMRDEDIIEPKSKREKEREEKIHEAVTCLLSAYAESGACNNHIEAKFFRQWLVENGKYGNLESARVSMINKKGIFKTLDEEKIISEEGDGYYIKPDSRIAMELNIINRKNKDL